MDNFSQPQEENSIVTTQEELDIKLDDKNFLAIAEKYLKDTNRHNEGTLNLKKRREENEQLYFGEYLKNKKFKKYQAPFADSIIYEAMAYQKPMALSRFPDFIVTEGNDTEESKKTAREISEVVTSEIKGKSVRKKFGIAFKHRPVYLVGVLKPFWNPEKGKNGDWDIKAIHPNNVTFDHTATTNEVSEMNYFCEDVEYTIKEWIMRFPNKKEAFIKKLHSKGIFNPQYNETSEVAMNSKLKGKEFWFKHYQPEGDGYVLKTCVAWYWQDFVFAKRLHPYWDWNGEDTVYKFDMSKPKEEELRNEIFNMTQDPSYESQMKVQKFFRNHLEQPEFPYILMGYDQWGDSPLDKTSGVEQVKYLQQHYDKRGSQITDMLNRARGKHIFSGMSGMKAKDVQEMDMDNPDEDVFVEGKVNEVHGFIAQEQPSVQMVTDKQDLRTRIFDKMGVSATVRGVIESDTATTNQIAREGSFSKTDDEVEETVNYAAEKLANWILQFMKLFYTEDHFKKVLGQDGKTVHYKLSQDLIEDGMEVHISASGVDKLKAEQKAIDSAKVGYSDPISYFRDMGISDPIGRAEKTIMYQLSPPDYLQKFVLNRGVGEQVNALNGQGAAEATQAIQMIQQGQVPPPPQRVDEGFLQTFTNFMQGEVETVLQQFPQIKEQLLAYARAVSQIYQQTQAAPQPTQANQPMPTPQTGGVSTPTPTNTSQVAFQPPVGSVA